MEKIMEEIRRKKEKLRKGVGSAKSASCLPNVCGGFTAAAPDLMPQSLVTRREDFRVQTPLAARTSLIP